MLSVLSGFQPLRKLAVSNTAEIYHVIRMTGRGKGGQFAAKVLRDECAKDATEQAYLENEFEICSELDHPNLVHAFEIHMDEPRPFLILDLIPGQNLHQCMEKGPIPIGQALG
jgi:serine/threonine-protein kinase